MKTFMIALAAVAALAAPAAADPLPGYDRLAVAAPLRPKLVAGSVWYPSGTRTYRGLVGDGPIFGGAAALIGAGIAEGEFPLVLLSHGSGGNMDALAWLSSSLAARGAMVLAVNHPGSTTGNSSPRRSIRLDERAADLQAALDALLADPYFGPHVDRRRIAALGFSLGGATALNLAGARFNSTRYAAYCGRLPEAEDCVFFAKGGVDPGALPAGFEADMRDPRVTAAVAIDPGMTHGFTPGSIAALDLPVLLVNLGGEDRMEAGDVGPGGSDLANQLPNAAYETVGPANHFSFLAECKPGAAAILEEEQDDPICTDPAGADRAALHAAIVDRVAAFLNLREPGKGVSRPAR